MGLTELLREKRPEILTSPPNTGPTMSASSAPWPGGEADEASDVDILVELEPGRSLFDLGGVLMDLENLLGCKVDVVTVRGLRKRIRERVLKEAVPL